MRVHDVKQNTPEWEFLRAGIPTASAFDKIITPTGKLSKSARDYKAWLLAERVMRKPIETVKSHWMDRGTEFEAEAVSFYEMLRDCSTERIGFVTNDEGTIGASPDRWSGDEGQVEIKVPAPHTHMAYYIAQESLQNLEKLKESIATCLATEYKVQTMGQLWITERKWADLLSYSPEGLPPVYVHLKRDEEFISILAQSVTEFSRDLEESAADLVQRGVITKP